MKRRRRRDLAEQLGRGGRGRRDERHELLWKQGRLPVCLPVCARIQRVVVLRGQAGRHHRLEAPVHHRAAPPPEHQLVQGLEGDEQGREADLPEHQRDEREKHEQKQRPPRRGVASPASSPHAEGGGI